MVMFSLYNKSTDRYDKYGVLRAFTFHYILFWFASLREITEVVIW